VQIAQEKYLWSNSIGKYTHEKYGKESLNRKMAKDKKTPKLISVTIASDESAVVEAVLFVVSINAP
jgi:hypothetical protein